MRFKEILNYLDSSPHPVLSINDIVLINQGHLKPPDYAYAITFDDGFENNPHLESILNYAKKDNSEVVVICANIEEQISKLEIEEKMEYLIEMGQKESGLDKLAKAGYKLLGLQTFFTAGPQEVRGWTINIGDKAPRAAGKIHGDFEKGFIRAETISYEDYISNNGEKGAKEAGKLRSEGKDYIVQDGDVMHFLFNN